MADRSLAMPRFRRPPTARRRRATDRARRLPVIFGRLVDKCRQGGGAEKARAAKRTPRLREVLQLVAEGSSTKEIARALRVTVTTIETNRAQLVAVLAIHAIAGRTR